MLFIKNMKQYLVLICGLFFCLAGFSQVLSDKIKVNQIGYITCGTKWAYVSSDTPINLTNWTIKDADTDQNLYNSTAIGTGINDAASDEWVYKIDFSEFQGSGEYYLNVNGVGDSYVFLISDDVYEDVYKILIKGFYYQRSGVKLLEEQAGQWARQAEYESDAYIYEGFDNNKIEEGDYVDVSGGWRDAGDPNKKVGPAALSVSQLMMLFEYFPQSVSTIEVGLPQDQDFIGLPDILKEIKFKIDWLLKMQRDDGAVWHGVGQDSFYLAGMGHEDPDHRYIMPASTVATASLASTLAMAHRIFKPINTDYANMCLDAAEAAWVALNNADIWNNPTIKGSNGLPQYPEQNGYSEDPPGINHTVNYPDTSHADNIYWAAIELYITTGENVYKSYIQSNLDLNMFYASSYLSVANIANLSLAMSKRNQTPNSLITQILTAIQSFSDSYTALAATKGFGISMNATDFYWGSNTVVGHYAFSFILAYELFKNQIYLDYAQSHLNYLLGANALNKTFVSGLGDNGVENIFHLPSFHDGVNDVVPGFVPGGPNQYPVAIDQVHYNYVINNSPAPAKCYVDSEYSFASNEPTLTDCAVWSFVAGYFSDHEVYAYDVEFCNDIILSANDIVISNQSSMGGFTISGTLMDYNVKLYDFNDVLITTFDTYSSGSLDMDYCVIPNDPCYLKISHKTNPDLEVEILMIY